MSELWWETAEAQALLELRRQWTALTTEPLHQLPKELLIASIRDLAKELLKRTPQVKE